MRLLVILLLILGSAMAFTVTPDYFDIQDTGNKNLETMDIRITIDCDNKDLIVTVMEDEQPVEDAEVTMFYTDYGYQPLPNRGNTDADGILVMPVPGTLDFLTGLFILRVDHQAHQTREIEFAYEKCFDEPPEPELYEEVYEGTMDVGDQVGGEAEVEPVPIAEEEPEETVGGEPEVIAGAAQNESGVLPAETMKEDTVPAESCPLGVVLISLLMIKAKI